MPAVLADPATMPSMTLCRWLGDSAAVRPACLDGDGAAFASPSVLYPPDWLNIFLLRAADLLLPSRLPLSAIYPVAEADDVTKGHDRAHRHRAAAARLHGHRCRSDVRDIVIG